MLNLSLMTLLLDNLPFGIYILDNKGKYIYVNATYVSLLKTGKQELLGSNVHDFVDRGELEFCISDIIYSKKKRMSMIQEARLKRGYETLLYKHFIISTPMLNAVGDVTNIIAVCIPLDRFTSLYSEAAKGSSLNLVSRQITNPTVIAESPEMRALLKNARRIAQTDASILISGESGTGKEVIAQYIHDFSKRSKGKLIAINCASLPGDLLEAELFGYAKGAFTGASASGKRGLIEEANGGILFLDEINSMPLQLQGKLLRVLETKTIQKLGSTENKKIDFQLISATNESLEAAIKEKRFRSDLYYRLNVIPLRLPSLAERRADIIPLAEYFLKKYNRKYDKNITLSNNTLQIIKEYEWPGNVRELKNCIERIVIMSSDNIVEHINLKSLYTDKVPVNSVINQTNPDKDQIFTRFYQSDSTPLPLSKYLEKCEKEYLSYAISLNGSTYKAAEYLQTSQSLIMRRKKKYQL